MMIPRSNRVAVNARFRTRTAATGVDFYAAELLDGFDGDELQPSRLWRRPGLSDIWEQCILPLRCLGQPLISPCNTGPWIKRRQLLIIHDTGPMVGPEWFSRAYRWKARFMTRRVGRRVRVLASVSSSAASDVKAEADRVDEVVVIPNVPTRREPTAPPSEAIRPLLDQRFVLSVATSDPRKNLQSLLAAWRRVERSDLSLVLVGGSASHVFADEGNHPDPPRVLRVGRITDSDLAHLMDACALVATVPLYEGFGRVVVEAQLHERPVLASDIAAHREVAAPGVLFVAPTDIAAIAAALQDPTHQSEVAPPHMTYTNDSMRAALSAAIEQLRD